jgi:predicted MFS family arabinose efflux permease
MTSPRSSVKPPTQQGFGPVLANPRFIILWVGQIFSQLADKVYLVLMIALIAGHFQKADQPISGWVSAIMIAFTIPAVLFGWVGGVYVDRWSKKGVLVVSNLIRCALVMTIPPLLWLLDGQTIAIPLHGLPESWRQWQATPQDVFYLPAGFLMLWLQTFTDSTLTQFFAPAEQAIIPLVVKRRHLLPANSLFTTTMMGMLIVGFAVGEPLLRLADRLSGAIGIPWDLGKTAVVGGAYLLSGIILCFLRTKEKSEPLGHETPHPLEDLKDGLRYLQKNPKVRNAMIQLVILFSIFAALSVLAVSLAERLPNMQAEQFGFLLATAGLGMALGAGLVGNVGQRFAHQQLSLWGSLGVGLALLALSLSTQSLTLALLTTTILGLFASFVGVPMQTDIQAETPASMRGKVFGLQNNVVNIALSLPLAVAGIAETRFGLRPVLLSLAIMAIAGGLLTWYFAPKLDK